MARKKTSKQKASPAKEFSSSPFKSLKGLSAFDEQQPKLQKNDDRPKPAETREKPEGSGEEHSFADEMDFLGVKPLSGVTVEASVPENRRAKTPVKEPVQSREERDKAAFLEALGSMESTFKDEWSEAEPTKQAVPRRMRQVERGQLKPQAELDLHGLVVEEASAKVRFFLQDSLFQGFQTVLIITGKGLHSNGGPVLRRAIEKLLGQQREQVIEWGVAPRSYGGDGALVVFLRSRPE